MKLKISLTFFCLWLGPCYGLLAQEPPSGLTPYFSAILVKDMEASKVWYIDNLGFEEVSTSGMPDRFSIVNMSNGQAALELIELASAVSAADVIPDYNTKLRVHGFFKSGFQVSDLDAWVSFLQDRKVAFHGDVVEDPVTKKRMVIILDPDGNRIQLFED